MAGSTWKHFACSRTQLCLDTVLVAGQSFRWKQNISGEWMGVMADRVWRLKQADDRILFQVYGPAGSGDPTGLKCVSECAELKLAISPTKEQKSNDAVVKAEICHDYTETEVDQPSSQNRSNVRRGRAQQKIKKETASTQIKNGRMKLLAPEDSDKHNLLHSKIVKKDLLCREIVKGKDLLCPETVKRDLLCEKTIKREDLLCPETVKWQTTGQQAPLGDSECTGDNPDYSLLRDYFQLNVDLDSLYSFWSSKDAHFKTIGGNFQGVRLLRLHPTECLLSFVCSANNHISRISSMVEKLCTHYGDHITTVEGVDYYTFPSLSKLCGDNVESHLRELGFGYRAKYIASIARHVTEEKNDGWLESLRESSYSEAKKELMSLLGVGAKVADCVCLMSLDKPEALPVDTHIWQLTLKNYIARLHSAKSLTDKIYNEIGDFYRALWGPYAGWAQAVMFASSLRQKKKSQNTPDEGRGEEEEERKADDPPELSQANKRKERKDQQSSKGRAKKRR